MKMLTILEWDWEARNGGLQFLHMELMSRAKMRGI
jgi:hypothetical protein